MSGSSSPPASFAPPISVGLVDQGTIRIASIAGQVVPIPPGGDTASPDVLFTEAGDVTINFQTVNVPQGTELSVRVTARGVVIDATSTPVDALGAASATLTVPAGVGTIQAFADYLLP